MINYGGGVSLRTIDKDNFASLRLERNEPEIRKWCRQTGLINEQQHEKWFNWQATDPNTRMYIAYNEDPQKAVGAVGVVGLTSIDWHARKAEFSCYIFRNRQRNGFARSALKTLFEHGFRDLNLNIIWGETFDGNPALELFLELGMQKEGTRRDFYFKDGKYLDAHLVSVRREEWKL